MYSLVGLHDASQFGAGRHVRRVLVPVLFGVVFLAMYGYSRAVQYRGHQAYELAAALHARMQQGDWDAIYRDADPGYRQGKSSEQFTKYFRGLVQTLGAPESCMQGATIASAEASGSTIQSYCTTTFSSGKAANETFIWREQNGQYRLFDYRVTSDEFVTE